MPSLTSFRLKRGIRVMVILYGLVWLTFFLRHFGVVQLFRERCEGVCLKNHVLLYCTLKWLCRRFVSQRFPSRLSPICKYMLKKSSCLEAGNILDLPKLVKCCAEIIASLLPFHFAYVCPEVLLSILG